MSTTISVLANETLCEIFQHLADSLTVNEWYTQTLPSIRLVSSQWNEIIETLPMLWTSILISERSASQSGKSPFQSTRLRLLRSLELPLNIHINLRISPKRNSFNESDGAMLGEMIQAVAPRITSIEIRTNSDSRTIQMSILARLNGIPMPLLHTFIHADPKPPVQFHDTIVHFLHPSSILQHHGVPETRRIITEWGRNIYPSLTHIDLTGVIYNLGHLPVMRGIRSLCIEAQPLHKRPTINQMLELLYPARDTLEVLQLEDVIRLLPTDPAATPLSNPIIFKKLHLFSFGYYHSHIADVFLQSVRLPALVDLTLSFTFGLPLRFPNRHIRILDVLMDEFPLGQIKSLTLVKFVVPVNGRYNTFVIDPREWTDSEEECTSIVEKLKLHGFTQNSATGDWKLPVFMNFLSEFRSLKHLYLDDDIGLKKLMSAHWGPATLSTLETLGVEGCPKGLFKLARVIEDIRKEGDRPLPLRISIGKNLKRAMLKEEKAELDCHLRAPANL